MKIHIFDSPQEDPLNKQRNAIVTVAHHCCLLVCFWSISILWEEWQKNVESSPTSNCQQEFVVECHGFSWKTSCCESSPTDCQFCSWCIFVVSHKSPVLFLFWQPCTPANCWKALDAKQTVVTSVFFNFNQVKCECASKIEIIYKTWCQEFTIEFWGIGGGAVVIFLVARVCS